MSPPFAATEPACCSLITICPRPTSGIVWFTAPVITIGVPFRVRRAISELPPIVALLPLHVADAFAIKKSAAIDWPAAVNAKFATDASALLLFPPATTVAWRTSAVNAPCVGSVTLAIGYSRTVTSRDSPLGLIGPVSASGPIAIPATVPFTTVA